jgi:hypothetical protein
VSDRVNRGNRLDKAHIQRWNLEPGVVPEILNRNAVLLKKKDIRYLFLFDAPQEFKVYRNTELLGEFFSDDEIGYVLDVYFKPEGNHIEKTMLVKLNTLMLDVTDNDVKLTDELIDRVGKLGNEIENKETLDKLLGAF